MRQVGRIVDRLLGTVAPRATAAACGADTCYYTGARTSGPCQGGYQYQVCCYYTGPGGCTQRACHWTC
jgi:hypothetical protein